MSKSKEPKKDDHLDEATLFEAGDQLPGSVESADYKHLVLSLVFLNYISDSFETRQQALDALTRDSKSDWLNEDESGASSQGRADQLHQLCTGAWNRKRHDAEWSGSKVGQ